MCSRYPNCGHAGPLMDRRDELGDRHCETVLPNDRCPYLFAGCQGCTHAPIKATKGTIVRNDIPAIITPDVLERFNLQPIEIPIQINWINEPLALAVVANALTAYQMLQRLVRSGLVTQEWANRSLENAIQYTYRQMVCCLVAAYLFSRSETDETESPAR